MQNTPETSASGSLEGAPLAQAKAEEAGYQRLYGLTWWAWGTLAAIVGFSRLSY